MIRKSSARARRAAAAGTVAVLAAAALAAGTASAFAVAAAPVTVRVFGSNAIGTAVAASQQNWADNGTATNDGLDGQGRSQAQAVVLSRSDQFYDALSGSDLAVYENAPLLITPPTSLNASTENEIKRILPKGATVYMLGGTAALSTTVQNKIEADGYNVQRLSGSNEYGTAVAVDKQILGPNPTSTTATNVFIATGTTFYDALSAGGAAGFLSNHQQKTVIVLTQGSTMPATSAAFLNSLTPNTSQTDTPNGTDVITIGGPGDNAFISALENNQLPSWTDLQDIIGARFVGSNAVDTAIQVGGAVYGPSPEFAAVATNASWYDALTGGAMVGTQGGPLLLTGSTGLNAEDYTYLNTALTPTTYIDGETETSIGYVEIMGGTAALPENVITGSGGIDAALGGSSIQNHARGRAQSAVHTPDLGATRGGLTK